MYANAYTPKHKGHSLTLALLPPSKPHNLKLRKRSEKSLYMSETRLGRVISKRKPLFASVAVETNTSEEVKPLHCLPQPLLKEFEDVFPNDLHLRQPPLRGIENQIDLLLGTPFPNKLFYRSNPNESKELQREVQKLLNHEHIQERLSPFLVLAL